MGRQGKAPLTVARKGKGKEEGTLGKALQRRQAKDSAERQANARYENDVDGSRARGKYVSILESNSLEDFIASAMLMEREFESQKAHTVILNGATGEELHIDSDNKQVNTGKKALNPNIIEFEQVSVPRRPHWDESMSADELDRLEREAFIQWRRDIAQLEEEKENVKVTPFEKNIEVWRQLWRVMEKSDLIVQIVDARNPLFFYSKDLFAYASELTPPKPMLILVNKSDYLSSAQRREWAAFFIRKGWQGLFFSARESQVKLNTEARIARGLDVKNVNIESSIDEITEADIEAAMQNDGESTDFSGQNTLKDLDKISRILSCEEFLHVIEYVTRSLGKDNLQLDRYNGRVCVGMIGYPNVGKSSVINVLAGATPFSHSLTRVSVGATPGKTKHFQTIVLSDTLMLCDCPGLVFPSFVNSSAEMICAGILPIMQMRDAMAPITLIANRVPRHILELTYTIKIPNPPEWELKEGEKMRPPTAAEVLGAICETRGLYRAGGQGDSDMPRAARMLLKDYTEGKLLFCYPPPDLSPDQIDLFIGETEQTHLSSSKLAAKLESQLQKLCLEPNGAPIRGEELSIKLKERDEAIRIKTDADLNGPTKLEQGFRRWGKKNKKMRDKTPYSNWEGENEGDRPHGIMVAGGKKANKKHLKHAVNREANFVRAVLPHHPSYNGPDAMIHGAPV